VKKAEPDTVFVLAGEKDPLAVEDPYLLALLSLPPKQRRLVARQTMLLCGVVDGLDPLGALELLAKVSPFVEVNRPDG